MTFIDAFLKPGPARRTTVSTALAAAVIALVGVAARLWLGSAVPLTGDEAVSGIMANELLSGKIWWIVAGNSYGGTADTWLAAPLLALFPGSSLALRSVFVALWGLAAVLLGLAARTLVKPRLAALVGCTYWLFSWSTVLTSVRAWSGYAAGGAAFAGWLCLQLRGLSAAGPEGESRWRRRRLVHHFAAGSLAGLAVWQHPVFLAPLVPGFLFVAFHYRQRFLHWAVPTTCGLATGLLPFLLYNLSHSWASLREPDAPSWSYGDRLVNIFGTGLPRLLGLRLTGSQASFHLDPAPWVGGAWGRPLAATIGLTVMLSFLLLLRRSAGPRLIGIVGLSSPFILALFRNSIRNVDGRHALFLPPLALLALASAWQSSFPSRRIAPWLIAVLPLCWASISCMPGILAERERSYPVSELPRIRAVLETAGVHFVRGDFWIAYPLTFETHEAIVATELNLVRFPRLETAVQAAGGAAAHIFRDGSGEMLSLRDSLDANPRFLRMKFGDWTVYIPR